MTQIYNNVTICYVQPKEDKLFKLYWDKECTKEMTYVEAVRILEKGQIGVNFDTDDTEDFIILPNGFGTRHTENGDMMLFNFINPAVDDFSWANIAAYAASF